tara:strand:+ start:189532 stop:190311 length:780 start_codon:yes stop_codon:yes gene_type:complete
MKNALGDRMKKNYENRTKTYLPRRTYTIVRLDGKAFGKFTSEFAVPFDINFIDAMDYTAKMLCENVQGCKLAYVQSDEISLLLTDFDNDGTDAYFDGGVQKIVSVTASMATAYFNKFILENDITDKMAFFDSRAFTIPDSTEVENYFICRQQDCTRNSISMTAQALYSHEELKGVNTSGMQDLCMEKDVNWNNQPDGFKRGRMITKEEYTMVVSETPSFFKNVGIRHGFGGTRTRWAIKPAIWITKDREEFSKLIPKYI